MPIDDLFNDLKEKEKEMDIVKKRLADIFYEKERPFNNGKIKREREAEKSKGGIKKFIDHYRVNMSEAKISDYKQFKRNI